MRTPTVADGLTHRLDAALQGGIADELFGPHMLEQLLPRNHPMTMLQEMGEHLKDLGPELN
jgi:hypothetical protein